MHLALVSVHLVSLLVFATLWEAVSCHPGLFAPHNRLAHGSSSYAPSRRPAVSAVSPRGVCVLPLVSSSRPAARDASGMLAANNTTLTYACEGWG